MRVVASCVSGSPEFSRQVRISKSNLPPWQVGRGWSFVGGWNYPPLCFCHQPSQLRNANKKD